MFKLNTDGDPTKAEHWLRRDVWLSAQANLAYYSQKHNKRLILLEAQKLAAATIVKGEETNFAMKHYITLSHAADKVASIVVCSFSPAVLM